MTGVLQETRRAAWVGTPTADINVQPGPEFEQDHHFSLDYDTSSLFDPDTRIVWATGVPGCLAVQLNRQGAADFIAAMSHIIIPNGTKAPKQGDPPKEIWNEQQKDETGDLLGCPWHPAAQDLCVVTNTNNLDIAVCIFNILL